MGDRDNPNESRCLGVFGLSMYTSERELRELFSRYGPVDSVQVVYDYRTGKSRGFAFIYMKYLEDAVDARESLPGTDIDGHKIRIDYSITERPHTPTPGQYMGHPFGPGYRRDFAPTSYRSAHDNFSRSRSRSFSPRD
jgi:transformer-2 protein